MLFKREAYLKRIVRLIVSRKIRYLVDIVAQAVIAFLLYKTDSHVKAGILAIRFHAQSCLHFSLDEGILLEFGREHADDIVAGVGFLLPVVARNRAQTTVKGGRREGVIAVGFFLVSE